MKDAFEKALHERKLGGGLSLKISVEPDSDDISNDEAPYAPRVSADAEAENKEEALEDSLDPKAAPNAKMKDPNAQGPEMGDDERGVLESMMGDSMDADKALEDAEGRAPKTLGERAKLAAAKKLKSVG